VIPSRKFASSLNKPLEFACRRDAAAAGVLDVLTLAQEDCAQYRPPMKPTHVVVNPPWGVRLDSLDR
jgi:23S rRNA G2445 N2-methylase RlmL